MCFESLPGGRHNIGARSVSWRAELDSGGDPRYVVDRIEGALAEERKARAHLLEEQAERRKTQESLEVTEKALQRSQTMEVVGRLAGGVAHDFNRAIELGSASFLAKPFRRADLQGAVEDALQR